MTSWAGRWRGAAQRFSGTFFSVLGLTALLTGLGFFPLLGGPRYEAGFVAGLIAPIWASWAGARFSRRQPEQKLTLDRWYRGNSIATSGLEIGAWHALAIFLAAVFHGAFQGVCEPGDGFAFLALGAGCGTILAGLAGATCALLLDACFSRLRGFPRSVIRLLGAALPFALPVMFAMVGIAEFYWTPAVFVFSPWVGFFAGPLYETVRYPIVELLTYRMGSLLTALGVLWLVSLCEWNPREARVRWTRAGVWRFSGVFLLFSASLLHTAAGDTLGHRSTRQRIAGALGGTVKTGRCEVIYDITATARHRVERLGRDCDAHLSQLGRYFAVRPPAHVSVYLFANEAEKARYIGVGRTYVAKPWRHEVYLQEAGFPHPVLGHELAHVVAGAFGRGPFHVAGRWAGFFPDPGRIEGYAVAAAPREDSDATLAEWARAMADLGQLPLLERIFQLGFFGESAARSYMAAGAFVDYLHQRFGADLLRAWYNGGELTELVGVSLATLDADFRRSLQSVEPSAQVLAEAAQRFSGPAIFERRCPHLVDRLAFRSEQACGLDSERAASLARLALRHDPSRLDLLIQRPRCELLGRKPEQAWSSVVTLLQRPDLAPWHVRALHERAGDAAFLLDKNAEARRQYERALSLTPAPANARQLEVRLWALDQGELPRRAIAELLIAPAGPGGSVAPFLLGQWLGQTPSDPMASYLTGKNLAVHGDARGALVHLAHAARAELPSSLLRREARRAWLIAAAELEDRAATREALDVLLAAEPSAARRHEALSIAERVGVCDSGAATGCAAR